MKLIRFDKLRVKRFSIGQSWKFSGKDHRIEAIARRIVSAEKPPPLPSELDISPQLSELISSMLDRQASKRPSAKQVVEALQELLQRKRGQPGDGRRRRSASIHIVDTKTLEHRILSGHKSQVHGLDFSPNGRYLASGSFDREIRLWDLRDSTVKVLKGHTSHVSSTVFSPDGKRLASGSYDKTIKIWDMVSADPIRTLESDSRVHNIRFSPDGRHIISVHDSNKISL